MAHYRSRKDKAVFGDGTVFYALGARGFTHAWRVTGTPYGKLPTALNGWARSQALAEKATALHARDAAERWSNISTEVVEAQPVYLDR